MAQTSGETHMRNMMSNVLKKHKIPAVWKGLWLHVYVKKISFLKRSVNTVVYQDVLDHFRIPNTDKFGDNEFIFLHHFAPPHTVKSTKEWFREN